MVRSKTRSGEEAVMKLGAYMDSRNMRGWDLARNIKSYKELYSSLNEILTENDLLWMKEKLGNLDNEEVDGVVLDSIINDLRCRIMKADSIRKLLIKLKTQIQEELQISLVDAFQRMHSKISSCKEYLTREEFKTIINCFGIPFSPNEISLLTSAFDFFPNTGLHIESWVRELCVISGNSKVRSRLSSAKKRTIVLRGTDLPHRLSELSIKIRPFTASDSKKCQIASIPIPFPDNETSISDMSHYTTRGITDICNSAPGIRLLEASNHLFQNSNPALKVSDQKSMRCLGSLVYSGPGQNHEILGEVARDGTVELIAQVGVWCQIRVKNVNGWIPKHKVESIVDRPIYATHDLSCKTILNRVVEIRSTFLLRKEPNWQSRGLVNVNPGQILRIEGQSAEWVKVSTEEGGVGWVPAAITNLATKENTPKTLNLPTTRSNIKSTKSSRENTSSTRTNSVSFREVFEYVDQNISDLRQNHKDDIAHRLYIRELQKRILSKWMIVTLSISFHTWKDLAARPTLHEVAQKFIKQEIQDKRKSLEISIKTHREKFTERVYEEASKIRYSSDHMRRSLQQRSETERNSKNLNSNRLRTSLSSRMQEAKEELIRKNIQKGNTVRGFQSNSFRGVNPVL